MHSSIETNLQMLAMLWKINDPTCGGALEAQAPVIAQYWADRAAESPRIAKALEAITGAGGWMQGIAVHAPLFLVVFQHHAVPAIEARRQAMAEGSPENNGHQAVPVEGTEAIDPATGQVVVFHDGHWGPREETGAVSEPTGPEPASRTKAAADNDETPDVDRYGHKRGSSGTPRGDAESSDS